MPRAFTRSTASFSRRLCSPTRVAGVLACAALALVPGCGPAKTKEVKQVAPVARDVPNVLRGTIGAEASFRGIQPVLVSGLGIVVNLPGTGGGTLTPSISATMEREAARNGIGRGSEGAIGDIGPISPQEFLRLPTVAVVIVEARIPPGAPDGTPFDVYVRTLPSSSVTSLEGGTLWTTDLRLGPAAVFGAVKTRKLAEAKGPIYINPFSDPGTGTQGQLVVSKTRGRVLAGGRVTEPLMIEMTLDNDSHTRARSVVSAINGKFPREAGDEGQTARGRGSGGAVTEGYQSISLRVPRRYRENPAEFIQLVRSLRVDPSFASEYARQYIEELKANPGLAQDIRWLLEASGKPVLPFISTMYDYPEYNPRMATLTAGSRLGDARTVGPLLELAKSGPAIVRVDAMRLLADMPRNPAIGMGLRPMLDEPSLDIRVAAYEALRKQRDPLIVTIPVGMTVEEPDEQTPGNYHMTSTGRKFDLELVPSSEPMIYVTQQGQPRIVVFGGVGTRGRAAAGGERKRAGKYNGMYITKPTLASAFDDKLMVAADNPSGDVRLRYTSPLTLQATTLTRVPEDVVEFIEFLARSSTDEEPRPGLGMSYSDVVGTLYELTRQGTIAATFSTEEDRLRAEIFEASRTSRLADRPEGDADLGPDVTVFEPQAPAPLPSAEPGNADGTPKIVPLNKPKTTVK